MPSQWNAAADRDLLLCIIDEGKLQSLNWHAVAAKMAAKDYSFTHEACRQHFQKLRRASTTGASSTPNTPKTPKTPTSRKNKKFANNNDDDDEETAAATPSKKRKRAATVLKNDHLGGDIEAVGEFVYVDVDAADADDKDVVDLGGFNGQTAGQFKMETLSSEGDAVDLEDEEIYA